MGCGKGEGQYRQARSRFPRGAIGFSDPNLIMAADAAHSENEPRLFCIGRSVTGGILTVRFTYRGETIRIVGAGYWRKGRKLYEEKNQIF